MKTKKINFKKIKISDLVFVICVVTCLILVTLSLIELFTFEKSERIFDVFLPSILISAILFFVLFLAIEKYSGLVFSQPISIFFLLFILTFVAIFPATGFFAFRVAYVILFFVSGVALSLVALSICFAFLKNQYGSANAKPLFFSVFISALVVSFVLLFVVLFWLLGLLFSYTDGWPVGIFVKNLFWGVFGAMLMVFLFIISLFKRKKFVNFCLIQYVPLKEKTKNAGQIIDKKQPKQYNKPVRQKK